MITHFNAYAVKSEGGPVAKIAYEFGVPVIAIRTLLDKANCWARESYANFAQDAADNSSRVILTILKNIAAEDRQTPWLKYPRYYRLGEKVIFFSAGKLFLEPANVLSRVIE